MNNAQIGIDMINVGKGDAFIVDLPDPQTGQHYIIAIDAGTETAVDGVIEHISRYHTNGIDLVVSTHPDVDHIGGLPSLLEQINVTHLLLNDPRDFADEQKILSIAKQSFDDDKYQTFKSAFDRIDSLKDVAQNEGVKLHSMFASSTAILTHGGWDVYIVGPTENLFRDIWLNDETVKQWFYSDSVDAILALEKDKKSLIDDPSVDTKPVNNSSIMLMIEGHGRKYLFTGDAGKRAIREARTIKDLSGLNWLHVPHHGSRRNVDTEIIKHFSPKTAYISSPGIEKSNGKHPRKAVIKGLQNVGAGVYSTCRNGSMYHNWNLARPNYSTASPWPV